MTPQESKRDLDALLDTRTIEHYFAADAALIASVRDRLLNAEKFMKSPAFVKMLDLYTAVIDLNLKENAIFGAVMVGIRFGYWLARGREAR